MSSRPTNRWQGRLRAIPEGSLRENPRGWAEGLEISVAAVELVARCEVIDLHVDSFIWRRLWGYDPRREHGPGPLPGFCFHQVDIPRLFRAGFSGATWVITTNPLRSAQGRTKTLLRNLSTLRGLLDGDPRVAVVRNLGEYRAARAAGLHAAFLGVQGGNALDAALPLSGELAQGWLTRVTLLHLTSSRLGKTSTPTLSGFGPGLSAAGCELVEALNAARIFVDLAHIDPSGFAAAAGVHDRSLPLVVTHTGVRGVHPHWRNLSDEQLRVVASFGGTVGIMFHSQYLGDPMFGGRAATVFEHLRHTVSAIGDEHVSLGSDWDGAIVTPRDMPTCLEFPRLVQLMLEAGWSAERIERILAGNFLRCLGALRGAAA